MIELSWDDPLLELKLVGLNVPRYRISSIMESRPRVTQIFAWPSILDPDDEVRCKIIIRPEPPNHPIDPVCYGAEEI